MTMKKHPELILPPKAILPPPPTTLEEAKKRIHANIKNIEASADAIRKRAVEIGRDLIVVKSIIAKHGDFLDYVKTEFQMKPRTAQRYMRVSEFIEVNPDMMQEGVALSALYAVMDTNLAPEVLESIKKEVVKGSIPTTGAGVKKAIAAKSSSAVVKSKKTGGDTAAAALAVSILASHLYPQDLENFAKLFRKAGAAFAPALKELSAKVSEDVIDGPY